MSRIDRLGDALRASVEEGLLLELNEFRATFFQTYAHITGKLNELNLPFTARQGKTHNSILAKLHRQKSLRLSQMQDIVGCRYVVTDTRAQEMLVEIIGNSGMDLFVDDKREHPTFGYRAVHLIAKHEKRIFEIQIRTELQHAWAQTTESLSDLFGHELKYGGGRASTRDALSLLSDGIRRIEAFERDRAQRSQENARNTNIHVGTEQLDELAALKAEILNNLDTLRERASVVGSFVSNTRNQST